MTDYCGCGTPVPSEAAKQRHAKVCDKQGLPGCRVTRFDLELVGGHFRRCGEPADETGLCVRHRADKERLS